MQPRLGLIMQVCYHNTYATDRISSKTDRLFPSNGHPNAWNNKDAQYMPTE